MTSQEDLVGSKSLLPELLELLLRAVVDPELAHEASDVADLDLRVSTVSVLPQRRKARRSR
jgi:hypothetical protein